MVGDLDLGDLQAVGGKVAAQRLRQAVFRLCLDRCGVAAIRLQQPGQLLRCSGFTSPLSRNGVPSWPMET